MNFDAIHARASIAAKNLKVCEIELINALEDVDRFKVYRKCGATSLFKYATHILGLSESRAYDFIVVMRKGREVEKFKQAVIDGLSITKARRLTKVINDDNACELVHLAKTSTLRDMDHRLSAKFPSFDLRGDRIRPLNEVTLRLEANLEISSEQQIRRVQDLESQRLKRP